MAKVQQKSEKISAFGGIIFVLDKFDRILSSVIDSHLGLRSKLIGYQYSEIIRAVFSVFCCGGDCMEDLNLYLKDVLAERNQRRNQRDRSLIFFKQRCGRSKTLDRFICRLEICFRENGPCLGYLATEINGAATLLTLLHQLVETVGRSNHWDRRMGHTQAPVPMTTLGQPNEELDFGGDRNM